MISLVSIDSGKKIDCEQWVNNEWGVFSPTEISIPGYLNIKGVLCLNFLAFFQTF